MEKAFLNKSAICLSINYSTYDIFSCLISLYLPTSTKFLPLKGKIIGSSVKLTERHLSLGFSQLGVTAISGLFRFHISRECIVQPSNCQFLIKVSVL